MERDLFQQLAKIAEGVFREQVVVACQAVGHSPQVAEFGDDQDLRKRERHPLAELIRSADGIAEPDVDPVVLQRRQAIRHRQRPHMGKLKRRRLHDLFPDPVLHPDLDQARGFRLGGAERRLVEEAEGLRHGQRHRLRAEAHRPAAAGQGKRTGRSCKKPGAHFLRTHRKQFH